MAETLFNSRRRHSVAPRQDSVATYTSQVTNATQELAKSPPIKQTSLPSIPGSPRNDSVDHPPGETTTSPINADGPGLDYPPPDTYAIGATHGVPSNAPAKAPDTRGYRRGHRNAADKIRERFTPAKRSRVWDMYVKKTEEEDKDLAEDWDRVIDVTLVFAALFSAIVTGFVLESSKNLQIDQSEATVLVLQDLVGVVRGGLNGSTVTSLENPSPEESFKPTSTTIWVNCLWFLSLGISISVSIFAMLAKRWCYLFRSKRVGTPYERAMKRQESWDAIEQWKIELVVEQLPTLMHMALMLFFIGLVVYLSEIHQTTMIVTAALVGFTLLLYFLLTILPLWYQSCPMVTPLTRIVLGIRYYARKLHKLAKPKAQSLFELETDMQPPNVVELNSELPSWRRFVPFIALAIKKTLVFAKNSLKSSWKWIITALGRIYPSFGRLTDVSSGPDWVLARCSDPSSANTTEWPTRKPNRHALGALSWILHNSKDRESVGEVLNHVVSFPEVILDSSANGKELYEIASKTAEHLNRFQHDAAEWRHALPFRALCARLIYLTARPWLHRSTGDGSSLGKIEDQETNISQEELNLQIRAIEAEKIAELSDPILWMEDLAGKIILGRAPESGLKLCSTLGKKLLANPGESRIRGLHAEVYPTLCQSQDWPRHETAVNSDSMLTLTHFRDLRKRQDSGLWLRIVGISGMLYAFIRHPRHEDSPAFLRNKQYFVNLISILHASLRVPLTGTSDPFIGELPVYRDTEIRLYQFDSLHYAFDALRFSVDSSVYRDAPFLKELRSLLHDLRQFRHLKKMFDPEPGCDLNYGLVEQRFKNQIRTNYTPDILLASGLQRYIPDGDYRLTRKRAKLLSRILPSTIFGMPGVPSSPYDPDDSLGAVHPTISDRYIEAVDMITAWAWMPFRYDSKTFQTTFRDKHRYPSDVRVGPIWESLQPAGLLQIPLKECSASVFYYYNTPKESPARTYGYCLYIKASLLARLYSFPRQDPRSPDILAWSVALSKHMAALLQFWDAAEMDMNEQAYVVTSLMHLVDTLFEAAPISGTPPQFPGTPSTEILPLSDVMAAAHEQLKELVASGVISILSRPFSKRFNFDATVMVEQIPDEAAWRDSLVRLIEKLARRFPRLPEGGDASAESEHYMLRELLRALGEGRNRNSNASAYDEDKLKPYSDLVAYYEVRIGVGDAKPSILELARRLRDDMKVRHESKTPQSGEPVDVRVRIDMCRD